MKKRTRRKKPLDVSQDEGIVCPNCGHAMTGLAGKGNFDDQEINSRALAKACAGTAVIVADGWGVKFPESFREPQQALCRALVAPLANELIKLREVFWCRECGTISANGHATTPERTKGEPG